MDATVFHHATAVQWHYIVNSKTIGRDSMMIYLVRHAHPLNQDSRRRCISRTDLPLDALGIAQAQQLSRWFQTHPVRAVYTSPLLRCRQTAEILSRGSIPVHMDNRLCEMRVGEWENLSFDEIRTRWPTLYALRGEHLGTTAPPGGESFLEAGKRLAGFLSSLPDESGDISIVTHSGILRGWLCSLLHVHPDSILSIPQPFGGITTVQRIDDRFTVSSVGRMPFCIPDSDEIEALYALYGTSANVQAHCRAVAECALSIAQRSTVPIDQDLLRSAALLHDLCRVSGRDHPQKAAQILTTAGYPLLGSVIACHHDLGEHPCAEAEILYLADKMIQDTQPVSLQSRFEGSLSKCRNPQAVAAWRHRYEVAKTLERKYCDEPFF